MWVAVAAVGGALVSGYMGQKAAKEQSGAAQKAAETTAGASVYATDLQREQWERQQEAQAPWLETGGAALNQLAYMSGLPGATGTDFQQDPGYQFRLSEGVKALDRSASARGGIASGRALKDVTRFGQQEASKEYQSAYNRLAGLANVGQAAVGQLGAAGSQYAGNVGDISRQQAATAGSAQLAAGQARASSYAGWGNALSSGIQGLGAYYGGQQQQQQQPAPVYTPGSGAAPYAKALPYR